MKNLCLLLLVSILVFACRTEKSNQRAVQKCSAYFEKSDMALSNADAVAQAGMQEIELFKASSDTDHLIKADAMAHASCTWIGFAIKNGEQYVSCLDKNK